MASSTTNAADPDPTTQIAWPSSRKAHDDEPLSPVDVPRGVLQLPEPHVHFEGNNARTGSPAAAAGTPRPEPGKARLTLRDFLLLAISMLGAQITWSVELGYGTPFLVGLGLSETATSLVWLAGPVSGLVAQPMIGAISDSSTSKYRRRYWISLSTGVLVIALTTLAYCQPWARFFVGLVGSGEGDWDPKQIEQSKNLAIVFAVVALYLLDFALNAMQASVRNLLLDVCPPEQLSVGNAWQARLTHVGNITGFAIGSLHLDQIPLIRSLGGGQFRKFCVIAEVILVVTVWMTCRIQEKERPQSLDRQGSGQISQAITNIKTAIIQLPKPVRRVCFVQMFAFMGWFPFLFYSTLYIGQVMAYERQYDPTVDEATAKGTQALLLYAIVAVTAGTLLPELAARDARLLAHESDFVSDDAELMRLRTTVLEWRAEAARQGKPVKLPYMPFLLRNIWTGALVLFAVLMASTFYITKVWQAMTMVALVGISWAVASWVPFAIIMEFLKEMEGPQDGARGRRRADAGRRADVSPGPSARPSHARVASTPAYLHPGFLTDGERQPLLRARSMDDGDIQDDKNDAPVAGGTVLGIHNLAIVMPQFLISVIASAIFKLADNAPPPAHFGPARMMPGQFAMAEPGHGNNYLGKNGVAWVFRFGGLCALFGAVIARAVPPTTTEKAMRRRLAHMRTLRDRGTV